MTLTDLSYKPIVCYSTGRVSYSKNKRIKRSHVVSYGLVKYLFFYFRRFRIKRIILEAKSKFDRFYHQVISYCRYKRIKIDRFYCIMHMPHHKGLRKRKQKRI
jgi:hypothetical protein